MTTLYLDIETKPRPDLVDKFLKRFPDYDPEDCKFGNIKDPHKIQLKLDEHREKYEKAKLQHRQDAIDKAALSPNTGEILCIQIARNDCPVEILEGDEKQTLKYFWQEAAMDVGEIVTWSGSNKGGSFDQWWIYHRSWVHNLNIPFIMHDVWKDCARAFLNAAPWGSYQSLEDAGVSLQFKVYDTSPVCGKNFAEFWETDREKALVYAKQDVTLLRQIWKRVRGLDQVEDDGNQMKMEGVV